MKNIHEIRTVICIAAICGWSAVAQASEWISMDRRAALYRAEEGRKRLGMLKPGDEVKILGVGPRRVEVEVEKNGKKYRGFVSRKRIRVPEGASFGPSQKMNKDRFRIWVYGKYGYFHGPGTDVELSSGQTFVLSSFTQTKASYQLSIDYRLNPLWLFRVSYFPRNLVLEGTSSIQLTSSTSTPQSTTRTLNMTTIEAAFRYYKGKSLRRFYEFGAGVSKISLSRLDFEDGTSEETELSEISTKFSIYGAFGSTYDLGSGFALDLQAQGGVLVNNTPKIFYGQGLLGLGYLF